MIVLACGLLLVVAIPQAWAAPAERLVLADFDGSGTGSRAYGELEPGCFREARGSVELRVDTEERRDRHDRCLRVTYSLPVGQDAETGLRIDLAGLDASGFDHLAFRVRGDAAAGYPAALMVGFKRPDPDRQDLVRTGTHGPTAADPVVPTAKEALKKSLGDALTVREKLQARLNGWPSALRRDTSRLPDTNDAFLRGLARDTWRGLAALTDREHALPIDHVRFAPGSVAARAVQIGDYTSTTNIGLLLIATVAASELGLIPRAEAATRIRAILDSLDRLETHGGFFFNFYDTTSLERTSNFLSFVDSAWLTAGLIVARAAFPAVHDRCTRLIDRGDYRFFYDEVERLMSHGYYVNLASHSEYHYGVLFAESRIGSLIAIGKGDVPEEHWFEMKRTLPAACAWQMQKPRGRSERSVRGHRFAGGHYAWESVEYVPSWGGSMFEALMPGLVLDEQRQAPWSLGANDAAHVTVQRRYAAETLGYPAWGISPSADPNGGYSEYGVEVLGLRGYGGGAVTPHAAALALGIAPAAAVANLRKLAQLYDMYGEYGLYDAVDPRTRRVAHSYLALDQAMILISLANHLNDHCIQKLFASDPIIRKVLPMIGEERFFESQKTGIRVGRAPPTPGAGPIGDPGRGTLPSDL